MSQHTSAVLAMALAAVMTFSHHTNAEAFEPVPGRWSAERANAWYDKLDWPVGANFVPSTAINQLEMWQADTFDPETIDRELGWAAAIGMNTMRVFLHDVAWRQDPEGFYRRVDKYLEIADKHGIRTMIVFFDGVWHPLPKAGKQPEPRPGVHNSGWVQSPGKVILGDPSRHDELKPYVVGVLERYKNDKRVLIWDLFNEPDNGNGGKWGGTAAAEMPGHLKTQRATELLHKTFQWARQVNPSQPLTAGVWGGPKWLTNPSTIDRVSIENSDIVSFHTYHGPDGARKIAESMVELGRPLMCTEYMARGNNSTFQGILPIFHKHRIGAYNWGLVDGKSQTIYPWDSWGKPYTAEPEPWFHDVFRKDGTPYARQEVELIRKLTRQAKAGARAEGKPNVLLILVDDLKPALGAYGDELAHSPNLDRLCARGMRFDRAYCNQAVCAPSRNNLMTSMRSTTLGVYGLSTHFRKAAPDAVTMPQHFMKHGYRAEGVGKVFHIGHGNTDDARSWSVPFHKESPIDYVMTESTGGTLTREEGLFNNYNKGNPWKLPRGAAWEDPPVEDDAYADGRIALEGIRRLRAAKGRDEPFFIALGFTKPHLPFCAPKKYWDLYNPDDFELAKNTKPPAGAPEYAKKGAKGEIGAYTPVPAGREPIDDQLARKLIHGYYASLSYMDAQVGMVIDELDRLGLADNTIVVLWGDHGYHFGHHGSWTKHTNYEQDNRIPIVFVAPGVVKPNAHSDAFVETVDIYPTLAELAGLPAPTGPQTIDGESLAAVLTGKADAVRDHAYHCFPRAKRLGRAIRTERYRMVEWKPIGAPASDAEYELYDYETDPLETQNIAADRPEVLAKLKAILARHPEAKPWR